MQVIHGSSEMPGISIISPSLSQVAIWPEKVKEMEGHENKI